MLSVQVTGEKHETGRTSRTLGEGLAVAHVLPEKFEIGSSRARRSR